MLPGSLHAIDLLHESHLPIDLHHHRLPFVGRNETFQPKEISHVLNISELLEHCNNLVVASYISGT